MDVLVVDDETIVLRLLTKFVSEQGHNVVAFSDAEEAWKAFQEKPYRLLISKSSWLPRKTTMLSGQAIKNARILM